VLPEFLKVLIPYYAKDGWKYFAKLRTSVGCQWFPHVAAWEAEIRRIVVQDQPRKID
jgi:hypothetical protein